MGMHGVRIPAVVVAPFASKPQRHRWKIGQLVGLHRAPVGESPNPSAPRRRPLRRVDSPGADVYSNDFQSKLEIPTDRKLGPEEYHPPRPRPDTDAIRDRTAEARLRDDAEGWRRDGRHERGASRD